MRAKLIAKCLSARQLIPCHISFCVCMYVCMSVTLRNANYVYTARMHNHVSGGFMCTKLWAYCCHVQGNVARSSKSLHLSTSVSEASENHGTEAMDNSR